MGEEFWVMAAGNMFAEVPLLRLSMLTANFTAPKAEDPGNKLQKQILEMEENRFQVYQKVEASFPEPAVTRAFGMLLIRCCMHL